MAKIVTRANVQCIVESIFSENEYTVYYRINFSENENVNVTVESLNDS